MSAQHQVQEWDFEQGGYLNFFRESAEGNFIVNVDPGGTHVFSLFGEWVHVLPGSREHAVYSPNSCIEALLGSPEFDTALCDDLQKSALEFCRIEVVAEFLLHRDLIDKYSELVAIDFVAKAHIRSIKRTVKNGELLSKALDLIGMVEARTAANIALQ